MSVILREAANPEKLLDFFCGFSNHTLSRRLLSFVPMAECLIRNKASLNLGKIGGFGSGSCFMEIALSYILGSQVSMYDAKLSANIKTQSIIDADPNISLEIISVEDLIERQFDFNVNVSVQTLEHIEDWEAALNLICKSVSSKKGNGIFIDVPYFNLDASSIIGSEWLEKERKLQWQKHEHYHVGFTIEQLKPIIEKHGLCCIEKGMSAFRNYDMRIHKNILAQPLKRYVSRKDAIVMLGSYSMDLLAANRIYEFEALNQQDALTKQHSSVYILAINS